MRALSTFPHVYLCTNTVDFRKSINGLSEAVSEELKMSPLSGALFVFMGRRRNSVKILYWDKTGFALWYKRLEEAKFPWQRSFDGAVLSLTMEQLEWLLSGVDIWRMRSHQELKYEEIG